MKRELRSDVYSASAIDWDRRLFDELIPLPDGTSYNAYLVRGSKKTALIDTVDPTMSDVLIDDLKDAGNIDYIIVNHAEQDHSGSLPAMLDAHPGAIVAANPKCRDLLMHLLSIPEERLMIVDDRETLSLGNKTLEFIYAPWVHWPETMLTYLREDRILFSCDFLASHMATSDLLVTDEAKACEAAKRYYAEIMMPFRASIKNNLEKIKDLKIDMIAPSHGPVYDRPDFILEAYREWVSDKVKNEVVIPFISMHGSTKKMVDHLTDALIARGIGVKQFDLTRTDIGKLATSLVDAATMVIGSPTILAGPHPSVVYAAYITNALKPKLKFASIIGSYGWGGKTVETILGLITNLKVELIEPVISKGYPKEEDFEALDALADKILKKHRETLGT